MSTVIVNPGQKKYKSQIENIFGDYDIFGGTDILGKIKVNLNEDAIKNAIKVWFASKFGERYRNPNSGGIFFQQVGKGTGESRLSNLQSRCMRELDTDFEGIFYVYQLEFILNKEKRFLEVSIIVNCPLLGKNISDTIKLRSPQ